MVGRGNYGYLQALTFVALSIPRLSSQLMPIAALLGGLIGLGMLANQNELTVIRAAGVSRRRIIQSVTQAALVLVGFGIVMGQWMAPRAEVFAVNLRAQQAFGEQPTLETRSGLWYRDAQSFVHIHSSKSSERLRAIDIYAFGNNRLREYRHAAMALYENSGWTLHDVYRRLVDEQGGVKEEHLAKMPWNTTIKPDLLDIVTVRPENMAIWELYDYLHFLHRNKLDAARQELAFWRQALTPVATIIMVMLSIPFVLGSLRAVSIGQRVTIGALLGIGFFLFDQMSGYVGLIYHVNPLFCASAPSVVFLAIAMALLRRV